MKVRFAVSVGLGGPDPDQLAQVVSEAEDRGFDSLWFSDLPMLAAADPLLAVAFAAARSERLKLGVNLVPFGYEPFVFARQVAQLDQLSGGRLLVTLVPGLDQPGERAALGIAGAAPGSAARPAPPGSAGVVGRRGGGPAGRGRGHRTGGTGRPPGAGPARGLVGWSRTRGHQPGRSPGRRLARFADRRPCRGRRHPLRDPGRGHRGRPHDRPEHFGLSIPYARTVDDRDAIGRLRRPGGTDLSGLIPVGRDALRDLVGGLVDDGMSKFVVRSVGPIGSWSDELDWLADAVLDLQT